MADTFPVKTAAEARDDGLRTLQNAARRRGVEVDVSPGSDYWNLFQAIGNEIEVLGAASQASADLMMPDTATGQTLRDWLTRLGLEEPPATGSAGSVVLNATSTTLVQPGSLLTDDLGQRYQVLVGGLYAPGASVPIEAIDTGASTNRAAGDVLRWSASPTYAAQTALVGTGGLTGGADVQDEETGRQRLRRRLAVPAGNGNATQLMETAEAASPLVQAAFAYPAAEGPATQHVAVTGYPGAINKSRAIAQTVVDTQIAPFVTGTMAEHARTIVTTVSDWPVDLALDLALPAPPSAPVPGPGGGWLDGTPWPTPADGEPYAEVTLVTSTTAFRVRALRAPTAGASRVAWLSPLDWTVYRATVTSSSLVGGTGTGGVAPVYAVTVDTPFPGLATTHILCPQASRLEAYLAALLKAFAQMGPGQKTSSPSVLARAFRRPSPALAWPSDLGAPLLRAVTDAGPEVFDVQYRYKPFTTVPLPAAITDPPNIVIPRSIAFYPLGV